jgi:hypothetical protein
MVALIAPPGTSCPTPQASITTSLCGSFVKSFKIFPTQLWKTTLQLHRRKPEQLVACRQLPSLTVASTDEFLSAQ